MTAATGVRAAARFEFRLLRAEWATRVALVLLAVAVAYAAAGGRAWQHAQHAAVTQARAADRARLDSLRATLVARAHDTTALAPFGDPRAPYAAGTALARRWAVLPPRPFGALATGQSDLFAPYARISMLARETLYANDELENPANLLAGRFDLAFVAAVLLPLVVIVLGHHVVAAEREAGTWRLVRAQPVSAAAVLAGKALARGGVVVIAAVALVVAAAVGAGVPLGAPGAWSAVGAAAALVTAYALAWFALALVVNVGRRSAAGNALLLLGIWLATVVLVPSLLAAGVAAWAPAPSRVALAGAQRDASDAATARGAQLLASFMQDHPDLAPAGHPVRGTDVGVRSLAVADALARATQPVTAHFDAQLGRQQAAVDALRYLSPALAVRTGLEALAGTDAARYRRFQRGTGDYVTTLRAFYAPMVARGDRLVAADVDRIPGFVWRDDDERVATRRVLRDAALLLAIAGALAVWAVGRSARAEIDA